MSKRGALPLSLIEEARARNILVRNVAHLPSPTAELAGIEAPTVMAIKHWRHLCR
jgi:hypothetical protein